MLRKLVILLTLLASPGFLFAEDLQPLRQLWDNKDYQTVLPRLITYWKEGGRTFEVEYMIGTSECRLPGLAAYGVNMLDDALQSFKLGPGDRRAVKEQRDWCQRGVQDSPIQPTSQAAPVVVQLSGGASLQGKGGYLLYSKESFSNSKIESTPIPVSELQKRRVALTNEQLAVAGARERMGGAGVASVGQFVVAHDSFQTWFAQSAGECLLHYRVPLEKQFQMQLPQFLVTVYAVDQPESVGRYAQKLHHLNLPLGTVAYSVYDDLSIVGVGGPESCGSLAHELVHLMIRRNFGNSPPWLEEGLASEVAVGVPKDGTFVFSRSWRDEMLKSNWNLRPTVAELIGLDWTSYTATSQADLRKVAAVHAMAAAFVRYLASKDRLVPVYFAIRDRRFGPDVQGFKSYREILEAELGKPVSAIDQDFVQWFSK